MSGRSAPSPDARPIIARTGLMMAFLVIVAVVLGDWPVGLDEAAARPRIPREQIPDDMPPEIRKHVEAFYSGDENTIRRACEALGAMGPAAAPAAPWIASLLDGGPRHRHNYAQVALVRIGPASIEPTIVALQLGDRYGRWRACHVLRDLRAAEAVPALVAEAADGTRQHSAREALAAIGHPAREYLERALEHPDLDVRQRAVIVLPTFRDESTYDLLIQSLGDPESAVRHSAIESIRRLLQPQRHAPDLDVEAHPDLLALLDDPSPRTRRLVLELLRQMRPGDAMLEALTRAARDDEPTVRMLAVRALGATGDARAVAPLQQVADDSDAVLRALVATALGRIAHDQAAALLTDMLGDSEARVRQRALEALAAREDRDAAAPFIRALDDGDAMVRMVAVQALKERAERGMLPRLKRLLDDPDPAIRVVATEVMAQLGADGLDGLLAAVESDDLQTRRTAVSALTNHLSHQRIIDTMVMLLSDADTTVRERAAWGLARHRVKLDDLDPVRKLVNDRNHRVRERAIAILAQHGDAESLPAFIRASQDRNHNMAGAALQGLARSGPGGLEALFDGLDHPDSRVRRRAVQLLAEKDDPEITRRLNQRVREGDDRQREAAARALDRADAADALDIDALLTMLRQGTRSGSLDPVDELTRRGDDAVGPVKALLQEERAGLRREAVIILGRIATAQSVDPLLRSLRDEDATVRAEAAVALGRAGERRAIDPLSRLLDDRDRLVRDAAIRALGLSNRPEALAPLTRAAADDDWRTRISAAANLARLGEQSQAQSSNDGDDSAPLLNPAQAQKRRDTLLALLDDPAWQVRRAAILAAQRLGDEALLEPLIDRLEDDHWLIERTAHEALIALTGQDSLPTRREPWRQWLAQRNGVED